MIPARFKKQLTADGFFKLKHLKTVGSTNDFLKALSARLARANFVVVADEQTSGRGRLSRKFSSPKGGLYFSILLAPKEQEIIDMLTVLSAVCVCDAVREVCEDCASIKWVNDVLIKDKKCCGILTETTENLPGFAIVGIGVNIGNENIDDSIKDIACGVKDIGKDTKWQLLFKILENFKKLYCGFNREQIVEMYRTRCSTIGRAVKVIQNDGNEFVATVQNIDDDCHLLVIDEKNDRHLLSSGEVKLIF